MKSRDLMISPEAETEIFRVEGESGFERERERERERDSGRDREIAL